MTIIRHVSLFVLITFSLLLFIACESGQRRPTRTYIPQGYEGWIRIEYRVAAANELPGEWRLTPPMRWNGEWVPASGLLQTSSAFGSGNNSSHEFYFYSDGSSTPIPKEMLQCEFTFHNFSFREDGAAQKEFVTFFIGKPGPEASKRCEEITKYETPTFPYFKMQRWSDLPATGNLNAAGVKE